ncbi:sigma 54-interacting transcriptional regulator [Lewinella sp. W8]|uniref:sigma 54-interacting transcriptional regulator n=1 Tax=Lewinella sp. W8 TaxID=2528208 RepID=UPI001C12AFE5
MPSLIIDTKGLIVGATSAGVRDLHLSPEELRGRQYPGLDARLNLFQWKGYLEEIKKAGKFTYETDLATGKDLLLPVSVSLSFLDDELVLARFSSKVEPELPEKVLALAGKSLAIGFFSLNLISRNWTLSEGGRNLLGIELPEDGTALDAALQSLADRTTAESWSALKAEVRAALESPQTIRQTIILETGKGTQSLEVNIEVFGNALHATHLVGTLFLPGQQQTEVDDFQEINRFSIEYSRDMIFWTRPDGSISYMNHSAREMLGYPIESLPSVGDVSLGFTDDVLRDFWRQLRQEKYLEGAFELIRKDGSTFPVYATINYLRYGDQEFSCTFSRDITAQVAREKRQKLTEFTLDSSTQSILWVRPDGQVDFVNDTFLAKTGYTSEEILNQDIVKLVPEADETFRQRIWDRLRSENSFKFEVEFRKADGSLIPFLATSNYTIFQGEEYDCLYLTDWTRKKKRDQFIELAQTALDEASDCIVWLRKDFTVRYLNDTALDLVGGDMKQWRGKPVHDLFPDLKDVELRSGETVEFGLAGRDGKSHQLELAFSLLEHEDDTFYVLTGRDVTERYQREQKLSDAYQQIEELSAKLQEENIILKEEMNYNFDINNIVTVSPKYKQVLRQLSQVADADSTVLILGETGTGKELLARAIHRLSDREDQPLIKVNCAALPENLIESELFGHEKGAFTGATARKKGRFELADGGTIFLDEIGEMPLMLQAKLLRVLQEGEFERLGGTETISVNVRLVAATNRDLRKMVAKNRFRADLYYRLNVFPIENLALRERPEDIPVLVKHFLRKFSRRMGKNFTSIRKEDLSQLENYHFPGNVRELENIVERAVVLSQEPVLEIPLERAEVGAEKNQDWKTFDEMQREYIIQALRKTKGRITGNKGAGRLLGLNDRTLMSKMRKFGIEKREFLV